MPTLYNGSSEGTNHHQHHGGHSGAERGGSRPPPRMGTIEVLLYNMASMLAGVAAGYDVKLSNVTPIHPKLLPKRYFFNLL
jgi:hypothetical protein